MLYCVPAVPANVTRLQPPPSSSLLATGASAPTGTPRRTHRSIDLTIRSLGHTTLARESEGFLLLLLDECDELLRVRLRDLPLPDHRRHHLRRVALHDPPVGIDDRLE